MKKDSAVDTEGWKERPQQGEVAVENNKIERLMSAEKGCFIYTAHVI